MIKRWIEPVICFLIAVSSYICYLCSHASFFMRPQPSDRMSIEWQDWELLRLMFEADFPFDLYQRAFLLITIFAVVGAILLMRYREIGVSILILGGIFQFLMSPTFFRYSLLSSYERFTPTSSFLDFALVPLFLATCLVIIAIVAWVRKPLSKEERKEKEKAYSEKAQIRYYVEHNQPAEIAEIAMALNLSLETIEKHIEALGMVKDANGEVYSDRNSMSAMRLEEWKKKREVVIKKWSEIAEKNPGLTQEELKEIYIRHYPDDEDIGKYLEEREEGAKTKVMSLSAAKIIRYEKRYNGSNCVLCILLCLGIVPGLLYYLLARETIPIYEGDEE